jgi:peptide deformylase
MALRNVLHHPHPNLRLTAKSVEKVTPDIQLLLDDMLETMYADRGIGLAATQIDVQLRAFVIDLSDEKNEPLYFVNPEIIEKDGMEEMNEGCLSVPGIFDKVKRAENIRAKYLDREGNPQEISTDGLLAVCIQHEIDHLNGKLFIDYLSPLKKQMIDKKLKKQEKRRL